MRPLRAALFGGFALSTLVPIVHSVILYGWDVQDYRVSLYYLLGTLTCNATGAVAYAAKVSPKINPAGQALNRHVSFPSASSGGLSTYLERATRYYISWS